NASTVATPIVNFKFCRFSVLPQDKGNLRPSIIRPEFRMQLFGKLIWNAESVSPILMSAAHHHVVVVHQTPDLIADFGLQARKWVGSEFLLFSFLPLRLYFPIPI